MWIVWFPLFGSDFEDVFMTLQGDFLHQNGLAKLSLQPPYSDCKNSPFKYTGNV